MKKVLLSISALVIYIVSFGQLSGIKSIPGDYPTIKDAIAALNAQGVGPGGVTFSILGGHEETFTSYDDGIIKVSGISEDAPVVFCHADTNSPPIIYAPHNTSYPTTVRGVIKFEGCDFVKFEGIRIMENPANSSYYTHYGFAILKQSGTNGSQHIDVSGCMVSLNKNNTGGTGIYVGSHTPYSMTQVSTVSIAGTNSFNRIIGNCIEDAYTGIAIKGFLAPYPYSLNDQGNDIGGGGGNTIRNFGGGDASANGILTTNQHSVTIKNNDIRGGTLTTGTVSGIMNYGNVGSGGIFDASGNTVSLSTSSVNQPTYGIFNSMTSSFTETTTFIVNNIVHNFSCPSVTTTDLSLIYNSGSSGTLVIQGNSLHDNTTGARGGDIMAIQNNANVFSKVTVADNLLGGWTFTNSFTGYLYSLYSYGFSQQSNVLINNNTFGGHQFNQLSDADVSYLLVGGNCYSLTVSGNQWSNIMSNNTGMETFINNHATPSNTLDVLLNTCESYSKTVAMGDLNGYLAIAPTPASCSETIAGNRFNGIGALSPGDGSLYGFAIFDGSWTTTDFPWKRIYNNWFGNANWPSTGPCQPFYCGKLGHGPGSAPSQVFSNTCSNIQTQGPIYGFATGYDASPLVPPDVFNNWIDNLTSTGPASKVQGCRLYSGAPGVNFTGNTISRLFANGPGGTVDGIYVASDSPVYISNNEVWGLDAPFAAPAMGFTETVVALNIPDGNGVFVDNNTVYLNATGNNPWFSTACIATSLTETVQFRNNIFHNASTFGAGGHTTVYSHTAGWNYGPGSDHNNLFAGTPGPSNTIASDGMVFQQTLEEFQSLHPLADVHSLSESTPFLNTVTMPYNLNINPSIPTGCESGAASIMLPHQIMVDRYGLPRFPYPGYPDNSASPATAPDIGAHEFGGIHKTNIPATLTVANVTIPSGVSNCYIAQAITVGGNSTFCIIQSGGSAQFRASGSVTFKDGCHFQSGSHVNAQILPNPTCGTQTQTIVSSPLEVTEEPVRQKSLSVTVFPNPTQGEFYLEIRDLEGSGETVAEISRLTGEPVMRKTLSPADKSRFNLQGFPAGIYLLRIIRNGTAVMGKIVLY